MDQQIELSGTLNFRDVGGIPVNGDRQVAYGRLFRSDTLQFLTATDVELLTDVVGLSSDIDLRLDFELEVEGRGLITDTQVAFHLLPFQVEGGTTRDSATPILQQDDPVVNHYVGYLKHSPNSVAGVIKLLAESGNLPAIVHCAAGKDRTGVAIAMVLAALGCTPEAIAAEYAAGSHIVTDVMNRLRNMQSYGETINSLPPEASLTPPEYIERFFQIINQTYGSAIDYLKVHGVTDQMLEDLFTNLTEPRAS